MAKLSTPERERRVPARSRVRAPSRRHPYTGAASSPDGTRGSALDNKASLTPWAVALCAPKPARGRVGRRGMATTEQDGIATLRKTPRNVGAMVVAGGE